MPHSHQTVHKAICEITKKVCNNTISICQGADILFNDYHVNRNSFKNWVVPTYKCMLKGTIVRGSINISLRRTFLDDIFENYGVAGLKLSLKSYLQTIEYYERLGHNKPGDRTLYNEYLILLDDEIQIIGNIATELDETDSVGKIEGLRKKVYVNAYERNVKARENAIKYHGTRCLVCGMSFDEVYGELGKDFIHIHHIVPISEIGKEYEVNYKTDLVPVCPNCHSMLHRKIDGRTLTIDELKEIIVK